MSSRLDRIQNWPELAREAGWCAVTLAKKCEVSMRTLQRHFEKNMGKSPKDYLTEQRQQLAMEFVLENKVPLKEVAAQLGYKNPCHFYRDFKECWGIYPTQITGTSPEI